jgi:predicted RNA-binding protein associated with RNAse of E/G family
VVLDEDEFGAAICDGVLTDLQAIQARETLARLIGATQSGLFPPAVVRNYAD